MSTDASPTLEDLVAQEQAAESAASAPETPAASAPAPAEETPPDEPAGETAEAASEPPEETPPDDDAQLLQRMDELTGYRLSERYTSTDEALRGLGHALKMLGQRDEDAQFGRSLREKYGDRLEAILKEAPASAPAETPGSPLPDSYDAYESLRDAAHIRSKEPGYESDPVYRRGVEATRALAQRTFDTIKQFEGLQEQVGELRQQLESQQQTYQATSSQQAEVSWWHAHQDEMCQKGDWKALTPLAKRIVETIQSDEDCQALAQSRGPQAALDVARAKVLASQPKPKPTKPVSPHAVHQPGVAPSDHRAMTPDELLQSDLKGPALLEALAKVEAGKA